MEAPIELQLKTLIATECGEKYLAGHSTPCPMFCFDKEGKTHEVIVKFVSKVHGNTTGLICEAMASFFARDLNLKAPQPFVVNFDEGLAAGVHDEEVRQNILDSPGPNFGSLRLPPQHSIVPTGTKLPYGLYDPAAQVLAFDFLIGNEDRHKDKPNCLMYDKQIAIIDHELAFPEARGELRRKPWEIGGAEHIMRHVFFAHIKGQLPGIQDIQKSLNQLPKERFEEYLTALPPEWAEAPVAGKIVRQLVNMRQHSAKYFETLRHLLR